MQTDFSPEEMARIRRIPPENRSVRDWCKLLADEDPIAGTENAVRLHYVQAVMSCAVRATPHSEQTLADARAAYDRACAEATGTQSAPKPHNSHSTYTCHIGTTSSVHCRNCNLHTNVDAAALNYPCNRRRPAYPSEHPDHICGMHCDGQDGSQSQCARTRRRLGL